MKKHMETLVKLDSNALLKKQGTLMIEIVESRRGIINGEIQNTQVVRAKKRELARVNTLLNMLSNSETSKLISETKKLAVKAPAKESKK